MSINRSRTDGVDTAATAPIEYRIRIHRAIDEGCNCERVDVAGSAASGLERRLEGSDAADRSYAADSRVFLQPGGDDAVLAYDGYALALTRELDEFSLKLHQMDR